MKNPVLIIAVLFIAAFALVSHFSTSQFSSEPVVLNHGNPPNIVMFGSQSCKYCAIARAFFAQHALPYTENDIDTSDKHRQMFYLLGGKGTPLIIVNGQLIHGFDETAIRRSL